MTNTRIFWISWCCFWALFWMLFGFFTLGLAWIMVPVSLVAILMPVGSQRPEQSVGWQLPAGRLPYPPPNWQPNQQPVVHDWDRRRNQQNADVPDVLNGGTPPSSG